MNRRVAAMTFRRRLRSTLVTGVGLAVVAILVCALFPSIGGSIGDLDLGKGVSALVGGGDFSTLAGYLNAEVFSIYGPLVLIGSAITGVVSTTAGEEEDGSLALILALPLSRRTVMLSKAAAVAFAVATVALIVWVGLVVGVVIAGGGVGAVDLAAAVIHMAALALLFGGLTFAVAAGAGERTQALAIAGGAAVASYLVNGLAPLAEGISWAQKLSPFYYYSGSDPLTGGVDVGHLAVLLLTAAAFVSIGLVGLDRRDLRG